jgi:hypothetical protein
MGILLPLVLLGHVWGCCGRESAWLGVEDSTVSSCTDRFRIQPAQDGHCADRHWGGIEEVWSRAGKMIRGWLDGADNEGRGTER